MTNGINPVTDKEVADRIAAFQSLPIMYEDDLAADMGQTNLHTLCEDDFRYGVAAHLAARPQYRAYSNLNLHYQPQFPRSYVSPDVMVVEPAVPLDANVTSYRVGRDGPEPVLVSEVLSERTAEERDLDEKLQIYALMGVTEYVLVDLTGEFLRQRLLLKRLQPDRTWKDEQDPDGGITSALGFRLVIEPDGRLRVIETATGRRYVRPDEAEQRVQALEAELARLRAAAPQQPTP